MPDTDLRLNAALIPDPEYDKIRAGDLQSLETALRTIVNSVNASILHNASRFGGSVPVRGLWTPTIGDDTAPPINAQTHNIQVGTYMRWGTMVYVQFRVSLTLIGAALAGSGGNIQVGGLPFTSENVTNEFHGGYIYQFGGMNTNWIVLGLRVDINGTRMYVRGSQAAGVANALLAPGDLTNATDWMGHAMYIAVP